MDIVGIALIAALLVCPLMMMLMHRSMKHRDSTQALHDESLAELRRRRDELDATIVAREGTEAADGDQERAVAQPPTR